MPRYAIGDIQGCYEPLRELLRRLRFTADRDELFLLGDLVNRGPQSLEVLRFLRALGGNVRTVLGNHDLHLLAAHHDPQRSFRPGDTLQAVLDAPDREQLMDWLIEQPLLIDDGLGNVLLHAGLVPDWSVQQAATLAGEAVAALRAQPREFLAQMYGNQPDCWRDAHTAAERHRFTVNVLTRLRYCRADGTIDLKMKQAPRKQQDAWLPWFEHPARRSADRRVIFGHWSTLGYLQRRNLLALDTGCVWGGALTAVDMDAAEPASVQVPCEACQQPDAD
ncbi:MAG: symmetrical bis(5'-nucleosyl)-tetraphosphatase [Steroidobacteraceae bacterium]